MPITIPDRTQIRLTTDFDEPNNGQALPAALSTVAMTNPGPVCVATNGATADAALQAQVAPAAGDAGRDGYIGYNPDVNIPAGGAVSPVRRVIVDGFASVQPGKSVWVDNTSADASGTASGLTHTSPTSGANLSRIGVGWSATKIFFE